MYYAGLDIIIAVVSATLMLVIVIVVSTMTCVLCARNAHLYSQNNTSQNVIKSDNKV